MQMSPMEIMCIKFQIQFSGKNKKNITNMLSAELAQRVVKVQALIVLGFNDTSTLVGHFVSSPREREKSDRRDSRRDEREGQGRK